VVIYLWGLENTIFRESEIFKGKNSIFRIDFGSDLIADRLIDFKWGKNRVDFKIENIIERLGVYFNNFGNIVLRVKRRYLEGRVFSLFIVWRYK
jgi:hypothetical protein